MKFFVWELFEEAVTQEWVQLHEHIFIRNVQW